MFLYPSASSLSKKQLFKEGPDNVAPLVIPALAPTLNRSPKSDGSLCPVRALRYYLDRTPEFGRIRSWILSPLRKVLTKTSRLPLSPLTRRPTLYIRLKPMMSGPFLYKAFQSGFSLEQILSAYH